ncbi:MAG: hypothetical protein NC396_01600 [Bacteroides sp.]|nr:hypothetical protein [Bacteroides sp.]MCM1085535.1 hypothetical protein [Bacteroides sp.]
MRAIGFKCVWGMALLLMLSGAVRAQSFEWKADADGFFDNGEYGGIRQAVSQTMYGFRFSPQVGVSYKDFSLFVGSHLQTSFGSPKYLDRLYFIGYFQYRNDHHLFRFGAFPRQELLPNYTDFFIRDTFNYFRPNMTGLFYRLSGKNNFLSLYLDWTGAQSPTVREAFFVGLSGEQRYKWFFAQVLGYYYHYANTKPHSGDGVVHDNGLGQVGVGIDFSQKAHWLYAARLSANFMVGYECKRDHVTPVKIPLGLVLDLHVRYWRFGTKTLYYYGQKRFTVPTDNHALTYWGNPILASNSYLQSKWYCVLFENDFVSAEAAAVFHLSGKELGTQYMVRLNVNLNGSIYGRKEGEERGGRYRFNFIGAERQDRVLDDFIGRKKSRGKAMETSAINQE